LKYARSLVAVEMRRKTSASQAFDQTDSFAACFWRDNKMFKTLVQSVTARARNGVDN
jgi:hypothetical protein